MKLDRDEHWPVILKIAGVYGEMTVSDLFAPAYTPPTKQGYWSYDFTEPGGPQMGTVAVPGNDRLHQCVDPVVIIATNSQLGIKAREELEMLVVIDRGDRTRDSDTNFFVFQNSDESFYIQWAEGTLEGCIGKVAMCCLPLTDKERDITSGFEEQNEDY